MTTWSRVAVGNVMQCSRAQNVRLKAGRPARISFFWLTFCCRVVDRTLGSPTYRFEEQHDREISPDAPRHLGWSFRTGPERACVRAGAEEGRHAHLPDHQRAQYADVGHHDGDDGADRE